ncbi:MAG: hypothetical protein JWM47_4563 [Acidimicrobiales bacterium]|nr:hypothetical protein [Acidimicrobiales bacterium]
MVGQFIGLGGIALLVYLRERRVYNRNRARADVLRRPRRKLP